MYTLPGAGGPIDIVLNATALVAVNELDVPIYEILKYNVKRDTKIIKVMKEVEEETKSRTKPSLLICAVGLYLMLLFTASSD